MVRLMLFPVQVCLLLLTSACSSHNASTGLSLPAGTTAEISVACDTMRISNQGSSAVELVRMTSSGAPPPERGRFVVGQGRTRTVEVGGSVSYQAWNKGTGPAYLHFELEGPDGVAISIKHPGGGRSKVASGPADDIPGTGKLPR